MIHVREAALLYFCVSFWSAPCDECRPATLERFLNRLAFFTDAGPFFGKTPLLIPRSVRRASRAGLFHFPMYLSEMFMPGGGIPQTAQRLGGMHASFPKKRRLRPR